SGLSGAGDSLMIIIIDEASAKLASFYYHDEIFRPEWRNASNMASVSGELQDELQEKLQEKLPDELRGKLYVALAPVESINDFEKTTIKEYADNVVKISTGNLRIPESLTDCIWIVSSKQQKQIADSLGIASIGEPQCGTRYAVESLAELDIEYLERVRRRYNHIPWDIGETDRCLIRELSLSDLPALYELYAKPGMTDYVEPLYDYETELEYQKAYIENMYGFYEYGMWLVFSKETGKLIGRAGLEHNEMGYMIAPEFWNMGYATEVCRFIIDYARENTDFEELYCRIDERNVASVRLAKKLGFVRNGQIGNERNTGELYRYVLSI
ncbi:MAG: GNAT family N-acetyltransferase, partial [Agathobacter sp.]|uniref:GNAT family N-acetyltransferase n=1 Tax=Agathobacter sp. TaxID=2021311 RepID=UPI002E75DD78